MKPSRIDAKNQAAAEVETDDQAQPPSDIVLARSIGVLQGLSTQELRDEWRRLYRGQPPRLSRDLLIRSLAYRMQESAHGSLSKANQRKLGQLAREMAVKGTVTVATDIHLRPGVRLMREWRGKTHTVTVLEDGFEFAGKNYPSLTRIAHLITGAHWSGPRFFGLNRKQVRRGNAYAETIALDSGEADHG